MKKLNKKTIVIVGTVSFIFGFMINLSAFAASTPSLGTAGSFGIISSTFTRNIGLTSVTGNLGYTTLSGGGTHSLVGTAYVPAPAQTGTDLATALSDINSQTCVSIGAIVDLTSFDIDGVGPILPGHYTPGCYSSTGAMNIGGGGTVSLDGIGTYIFRPDGALGTSANSIVALNGASECDIFWTPSGATTLGANSNFKGVVIDAAGITIGNSVTWSGQALSYGGTVTTDTDIITIPSCNVSPAIPEEEEEEEEEVTPLVEPVVERTSSRSSGTYFGCKDINALNYEYFSASKPSLCKYATTTEVFSTSSTVVGVQGVIVDPITVSTPYFPDTGFPPKGSQDSWIVVTIIKDIWQKIFYH